jgi:hypothetical protein
MTNHRVKRFVAVATGARRSLEEKICMAKSDPQISID